MVVAIFRDGCVIKVQYLKLLLCLSRGLKPNFRILDFFRALFEAVVAREASVLEDC